MESTETDSSAPKQANPATAAHAPRQATPVMDVTPPPSGDKPADASKPASDTPEAILATPPPDTDKPGDAQTKEVADEVAKGKKKSAPEPAKAPKPPRDSSLGIIIATVFIIGILAALAVFAYTQSK